MKDLDKYRGCLVGGAAGDALGYPVEFLTEQAILARYGQEGITGYELKNGTAEISDDTQMTLFTATGLLLATTRRMTRGIRAPTPTISASATQTGTGPRASAIPCREILIAPGW